MDSLRLRNMTYIGGNVCRDITTLGLDDGKSSKRASTKVLVHLGGTFQETGVKVENITGVSLTTRRTTEKEGHLTVSNSLLRQVIVDDQS